MQRIKAMIFGLVLSMVSGLAQADGSLAATKTANRLGQAMVAQNYMGVAKLTHPAVVLGAGGLKATAKLLRDTFAGSGVTITSMTFSAPSQMVKVEQSYIAVLPYTIIAKVENKSVELDSFYLAFSDDQRDWRFIDCEGASHAIIGQLAPGYNNQLKLEGC